MDKRTLIADVARGIDYQKCEIAEIIERTFSIMADKLHSGEEVNINGFGRFKIKYHRARKGYNPKNGQKIEIEHKASVIFSPSRKLTISPKVLNELSNKAL